MCNVVFQKGEDTFHKRNCYKSHLGYTNNVISVGLSFSYVKISLWFFFNLSELNVLVPLNVPAFPEGLVTPIKCSYSTVPEKAGCMDGHITSAPPDPDEDGVCWTEIFFVLRNKKCCAILTKLLDCIFLGTKFVPK